MKIYDFLRIQNRDILFMTSLKVKIYQNLKKKLLKFIYKIFSSFSQAFRVELRVARLDSLTFRVKLELESSFDRVLIESSSSNSRVVSSH